MARALTLPRGSAASGLAAPAPALLEIPGRGGEGEPGETDAGPGRARDDGSRGSGGSPARERALGLGPAETRVLAGLARARPKCVGNAAVPGRARASAPPRRIAREPVPRDASVRTTRITRVNSTRGQKSAARERSVARIDARPSGDPPPPPRPRSSSSTLATRSRESRARRCAVRVRTARAREIAPLAKTSIRVTSRASPRANAADSAPWTGDSIRGRDRRAGPALDRVDRS